MHKSQVCCSMNFNKCISLCHPFCIQMENVTLTAPSSQSLSLLLPGAATVQISFRHWLVLPALELHINWFILCTILCPSLFIQNILSCIHVACIICSFYCWVIFHLWIYEFVIHSSSDGRLGCFQDWAIMDKAAMKLLIHVVYFPFS